MLRDVLEISNGHAHLVLELHIRAFMLKAQEGVVTESDHIVNLKRTLIVYFYLSMILVSIHNR